MIGKCEALPAEAGTAKPSAAAALWFGGRGSPVRDAVHGIEAEMRKLPQIPIETRHHFICPGLYAREIVIPKDAILTGKIHKYAHVNFLTAGRLRVLIGQSHTGRPLTRELTAPVIVPSAAGIKRIALALENSRWVTVIPTDLTDVLEIERRFTAASEDEYQAFLAGLDCDKWPSLSLR